MNCWRVILVGELRSVCSTSCLRLSSLTIALPTDARRLAPVKGVGNAAASRFGRVVLAHGLGPSAANA